MLTRLGLRCDIGCNVSWANGIQINKENINNGNYIKNTI